MQLVNLTPHAIEVLTESGSRVIPASGVVARRLKTRTVTDTLAIDGGLIPITRTLPGDIVGLPDPQRDTWYIVSAQIAAATAARTDLLIPDDVVRDDQGRITGCRSFSMLASEPL